MQRIYQAPMVEEWQIQPKEAVNAVAASAFNDGEFGEDTWT